MTERDLQDSIRVAAMRTGWLVFHDHDSRRSDPGFPDLVLCRRADDTAWRGPRLLFIELKTDKGKATPFQQVWLSALGAAGQVARIVRPVDLDWLYRVLAGAGDVAA